MGPLGKIPKLTGAPIMSGVDASCPVGGAHSMYAGKAFQRAIPRKRSKKEKPWGVRAAMSALAASTAPIKLFQVRGGPKGRRPKTELPPARRLSEATSPNYHADPHRGGPSPFRIAVPKTHWLEALAAPRPKKGQAAQGHKKTSGVRSAAVLP